MSIRFRLMDDSRPFIDTMGVLVKHHGSARKAVKAIGIGRQTYARLIHDKEITYLTGTKIMAGYKKMLGEKSGA